MIKKLMIPAVLALMLVGCAMIDEQVADPNSPLSGAVNTIEAVAEAVQEAAPTAGPYGWIAGAVATIVAGVTGVYKVRQKNQLIEDDFKIINSQQREFNLIRDTTRAIVTAIEDVGEIKIPEGLSGYNKELGKYEVTSTDGTLAGVVKARVAEELHKRNIDTMGKAVISGIKAAKKETQKMQ